MSDAIRRVALQDALTEQERVDCLRITNDNELYVILNAAFARAEREGLRLNIDLSRSRQIAKRRRRP